VTSISYSSDPTILGTALLENGSVAVLTGKTGLYSYSAGFSYQDGFDKLQVAIVAPGSSTTLSATGLSFPSGDNPNQQTDPAGGGAIAALTSGKIAVLTWGGTSSDYDVTILNSDGSVSSSAVVIGNATGTGTTGSAAPYNAVGAIAAMPGGGYVAVWSSNDEQQTYMRIYNSANQAVGNTITISSVTQSSTGWNGTVAVDGLGNIILGFNTGNVFDISTYKLYDNTGKLLATGNTASYETAPVFVGLASGGFETADYTPSGAWNTYSGYPGFNLEIQKVSTTGAISTIASVANADTTDNYTPEISDIAVNAAGEMVFEEANHTAYDTVVGTTLSRDALTPSTPGDAYASTPTGNALSGSNEIAGVATSGTDIVGEFLLEPACFMAGTRIATPSGELAVEDLQAGSMVRTANGDKAVHWIGQSHIHLRFADLLRNLPVRIEAGALGDGLPLRDLLLSPNHALHLQGLLVHAGALVGLPGISREMNAPERFTYYHIELASHELLYAEGALAESFLDNLNDIHFHNWDSRTAPTEMMPEMDMPRVKSARQLPSSLRKHFQITKVA